MTILAAIVGLAGLATPASAIPRKSRQIDATIVSLDLEERQFKVSGTDSLIRSFELRPEIIVLKGSARLKRSELVPGHRVRVEYRAPLFGEAWAIRVWILCQEHQQNSNN